MSGVVNPEPMSIPFAPIKAFVKLKQFMLFIASAPTTASVSGFIFPPTIYVCIPLWISILACVMPFVTYVAFVFVMWSTSFNVVVPASI